MSAKALVFLSSGLRMLLWLLLNASRRLPRSVLWTSWVRVMCGRFRSMLRVLIVGSRYSGPAHLSYPKTCVVCLSRLETRTKESNMYASHWEEKLKGVMKVKIRVYELRRDQGMT